MLLAEALVIGLHLKAVGFLAILGEKFGGNSDDTGSIEHMDHGMAVLPGDLHRRVRGTRGGSANEEGDIEVRTLHLAGDMDHLVERGGDETAQADDVDLVLLGGGQDLVAWDHDAEIDDLVAVAGQDDADNVLSDVMDIAFDGGHEDL